MPLCPFYRCRNVRPFRPIDRGEQKHYAFEAVAAAAVRGAAWPIRALPPVTALRVVVLVVVLVLLPLCPPRVATIWLTVLPCLPLLTIDRVNSELRRRIDLAKGMRRLSPRDCLDSLPQLGWLPLKSFTVLLQ